jgi:hypothetical protein
VDIDYSPLVGGFAVVLNDGRAAFLTAASLRFDPNVSINVYIISCVYCIAVSVHYFFIQLKLHGSKSYQMHNSFCEVNSLLQNISIYVITPFCFCDKANGWHWLDADF